MKLNVFKALVDLAGIRSRKYIWVLFVSAVVTAIATWLALQNVINGDLSAMVPEDAPSKRTLNELDRRFGSVNTLTLLVVAPAGKDLTRDLDRLDRLLEKSPYVKRVDYRMDTSFFEDRGLFYLTPQELDDLKVNVEKRIKEETIKSSPFYVDLDDGEKEEAKAEPIDAARIASRFEGSNYVKDGLFRKVVDGGKREVWGMIVTPARGASDINYARQFIKDLRARIASLNLPPGHEVLMSGKYYYLASEAETILRDVRVISTASTVAVVVGVFAFFPNLFTILLIFLPLLLGLAVDFGLVRLTIGELNVVTSGNFAILFGIGVAYGVHVYARFREERKLGHSYEDGMERSISDTGKAVFLSAATTAAAFFALMIGHYKGFTQLGFITGWGVVFSFLAALVVLPAVGKPLDRLGLLRRHAVTGTPTEDLVKTWGREMFLPRTILAVGIVVTALSVWAMTRIRYEMDYRKLTIRDPQRDRAQRYEQMLFGMQGEPAVAFANGEEELRRIVGYLERLKDGRGKAQIEKVVSLLSFMPVQQEEKVGKIEALRKVAFDKKLNLAEGEEKKSVEKLRRMTSARPFSVADVPHDVAQRFTGKGDGFLVLVYPRGDLTDLAEAMRFRELLTGIRIGDRVVDATNTSIVFAEIQDVMLADAPWVIALSYGIVVLLVLFTFGSIRDAFLALIPLTIGLVWMVGFLYLTGQKINFFNIIAIPAVIGIGVDNGVHVVHRYRVEGLASLRRLVRNLVRTLLAATLTTVLSFLSLLFAHHPGIRSLGEAASCGLVTTFLAAGFFLPAVIYVHAKASARIALASRRRGTVVWTLSFDPLTEFLKHRLREKKVPFRIMALDELPTAERGMAARMLKEEARGGLHLPVLENGGKLESLGKKDIPAIRALLDALPK